jgi:hypothetical protein
VESAAFASSVRFWEPTLKTSGFAAAIGFILGVIMVFWVRPDTNAGAVFIVVTITLLCFVISVALSFILGLFGRK